MNLLEKTDIHDVDINKSGVKKTANSQGPALGLRKISKTNAIEDAIKAVENERLFNSQLSGLSYQKMVQNRLSSRKSKQLKDYDAEVKLLASLQTDGVSMHNIENVLKRRPFFEH